MARTASFWRRARPPTVLLIGLAACALALALQALGLLGGLEEEAMAQFLRLRPLDRPDPRVVVCAIDNASIDREGRWPWPRDRIAALIEGLAGGGARVIAIDIVFAEPSHGEAGEAEDAALEAAIERAGNVLLSFFFRSDPPAPGARAVSDEELISATFDRVVGERFAVSKVADVEPNLERFRRASDGQAFTSNSSQLGRLSRYSLVFQYGDDFYPALALRAAQRMLGVPLTLRPEAGRLPAIALGDQRVEADENGRLWINYRGPAGTFATVSASDVLAGSVPAGALTGKLVFLGLSDEGSFDRVETPLGVAVPGVEVHATVADNLLNQSYIHDTGVQAAVSLAALLVLGLGVAALVAGTRRYLAGSLVAIVLVFTWPALCYAAFRFAGWHLQVTSPMLAGLFALVPTLRYQIGRVESRARQIRQLFQRYVSSAVVEEMLRHPERVKLGGESRVMTVMFCDIRGFTSLSEALTPEQLSRLLNDYFTPLTREVLDAGGTLDKYIGDALMAFFGAPTEQPDHARRACLAALAMSRRVTELNRAWHQEGRLPPEVQVATGFGINSGEMSVGNMGSEEIFDYTVLGDGVNLGSRIEGLNKLYGTEVLVSEMTLAAAGDGFLVRRVDRVRVKGKQQPVTLYELLGEQSLDLESEVRRVEAFGAALALYDRRDFAAALAAFTAVREQLADDGPSRLYEERCRHYLAVPPPADWDGVETMTSK